MDLVAALILLQIQLLIWIMGFRDLWISTATIPAPYSTYNFMEKYR